MRVEKKSGDLPSPLADRVDYAAHLHRTEGAAHETCTGLVFGERARGASSCTPLIGGMKPYCPLQRRPSFALLDAATGRCCRRRDGNATGMYSGMGRAAADGRTQAFFRMKWKR